MSVHPVCHVHPKRDVPELVGHRGAFRGVITCQVEAEEVTGGSRVRWLYKRSLAAPTQLNCLTDAPKYKHIFPNK